jgi:glycine cleavage system H protein
MYFSDSHEWVKVEEDIATIGISFFAQKELGEIVYIQLPKIGQKIKAKQECVIVESTKAATDLYTPISGEVIAVNDALYSNLKLINEDPEHHGWMVKIKIQDSSELKELMSLEQYQKLIF